MPDSYKYKAIKLFSYKMYPASTIFLIKSAASWKKMYDSNTKKSSTSILKICKIKSGKGGSDCGT